MWCSFSKLTFWVCVLKSIIRVVDDYSNYRFIVFRYLSCFDSALCSVIGQESTPPSFRSRSRRRWIRAWRSSPPWAAQWRWATVRRCSTAPPRRCAPRWYRSTPACWHPWAWTLSCESSTRRRPPASTCRTLRSSRSLGEFPVCLSVCFILAVSFASFLTVHVVSSGTIDDCEMVDGLVLTQRVANTGVTRVEKAKIGLIQFCLSPPKTDVS